MREILSQRLRELREATGLSQKELSKKISVSAASIGYYENGDRIPGLDVAAELADFFGVSLDYLAGRSDARTPEAADITARTGLSERAVMILEAKHKLQRDHDLLRDSSLLSWIIETSIPPLTFGEYLDSRHFMDVQGDTGEKIGTMLFLHGDEKHPDGCVLYKFPVYEEGKVFPLSEFAETDVLPKNFRRTVIENYRAYDAVSDKSGEHTDVIEILRKFYKTSDIGDSKFLFNREFGVGRIASDQTESILSIDDSGIAAELLASMCDESLDCVTALPIAALLDEITFNELKAALTKIRDKYIKQKEKQNAKEN